MKLSDMRLSAIGGTLCGIWASFSVGDLLNGALTALIGTLASFLLSRVLNQVFKRK
ncbi:hypothetical protein OHD16_25950 [Sphingobacterium sp. ML3W]|uniref:hypothetical protein n=1 Tax=Sphingobacterium sp. ML3W TaxID=1538644 RepID=UPI00249A0478|nr:hypothetical protein [Sphingobacterium sp. ML3W]WFA78149.1 hypothetical protein OGI71_19090 [Sphingobacterium sp. ML3W]